MDTIFAVSSGTPPAAIAIVRLSGPAALTAATALAGPLPPPRTARLRRLSDPRDTSLIDRALVLTFPAPNSATGEDLVELHVHGGRAVVAAVERALAARPGLRRAERGEFTRRALLAGRIDLTEAEGLGDLLAAETEDQRRVALANAEGAIRRCVGGWSTRLLDLAAEVEAALDFSDEDDVAAAVAIDFAAAAAALAVEMQRVIDSPPIERLRDGVRVVIAGPPNSGKSTLLNALAERDAAIVSPVAGTTRDRIEAPVLRDGIAYVLTDTAGLRARTDDPVEALGIERSTAAMAAADIIVWLGDAPPPAPALWVHARCDAEGRQRLPIGRALAISAMRGDHLQELWAIIAGQAKALLPRTDVITLNRRQRELLARCAQGLGDAAELSDTLLVAENIRHARNALDAITGASDTEAMLDTLFARFCVGK